MDLFGGPLCKGGATGFKMHHSLTKTLPPPPGTLCLRACIFLLNGQAFPIFLAFKFFLYFCYGDGALKLFKGKEETPGTF